MNVMKLREMGEMINETIDWEVSENERRVCVRQYIDPELDEFKRMFNGLDSLLSKVALQVRESVPYEWASSLNVLYFPQLGAHLHANGRYICGSGRIFRVPHVRASERRMAT